MEHWGPMFSFSGGMTSKMSQLKFEAHKFERASAMEPYLTVWKEFVV